MNCPHAILDFNDSRLTGIEFTFSNVFTALIFLSVYLPFESCDNYDEYMHYITCIHEIKESNPSPYIYMYVGIIMPIFLPTLFFGNELLSLCNQHE